MYRIEVNLDELRDAITALENFPLAKRETILPGLGAVLAAAVARGFNEEADPVTGAAWADLSPVTISRRAADGHDGKKLDVTGGLRGSFAVDIAGDVVSIGSNKIYATTMHFGAKRGAFGRRVISCRVCKTRSCMPRSLRRSTTARCGMSGLRSAWMNCCQAKGPQTPVCR
jgi:phage gpG-like protein